MGNQRLIKMENFILEKQKATMDELCDTFHLSKNTVRRDLQKLEDRGFITKVYGGAAAGNEPPDQEQSADALQHDEHGSQTVRQC